MKDEDVAKLLERLVKIEISILSVNPDPKQTIQDYRDQKVAQQRAADQLVMATDSLVGHDEAACRCHVGARRPDRCRRVCDRLAHPDEGTRPVTWRGPYLDLRSGLFIPRLVTWDGGKASARKLSPKKRFRETQLAARSLKITLQSGLQSQPRRRE